MLKEHFLAYLSTECSGSYCDHSSSVGVCPSIRPMSVRPSVHNFHVNNINQSAQNLVKVYITIRSRIKLIRSLVNLIMGQIEPEHPELFALEFGKFDEYDLFVCIYKCLPIITKLGQNVCDHNISDEFDYGSNRTRTV